MNAAVKQQDVIMGVITLLEAMTVTVTLDIGYLLTELHVMVQILCVYVQIHGDQCNSTSLITMKKNRLA